MPSSPVIPFDDPTILFINAGMNQFKDIFSGQRKVDFKRATSSQKCIRAGGKHNDLDNVGFTARHHTFFEMLGNFSFGDYYKEEAIEFAWEWATKVIGLNPDKLYATVFESDDEAFALWEKIAPELKNGRVMRCGKEDNFWSMGPIGPCGPCSELHYDRGEKYGIGPEHVVNGETDRFVEIWNLVFMQDNQLPDGTVVPLPNRSVDTGAGLERWAAILQNADTNYGIDIFQGLISSISDITKKKYKDFQSSHQVIADHIRALTFAIADGGGVSNEGRGYVLRRILRRAARHGRLLEMHEPFMYKLVPTLVDAMGEAYPEIKEKQSHVQSVVQAEEESFLRTLETGLELFSKLSKKASSSGSKIVDGRDVFKLYDTYGFPYDLTEILANEARLELDKEGFDSAMKEQQERSRAGSSFETYDFTMRQVLEKSGYYGPKTEYIREPLTTEATIDYRVKAGQDERCVLILKPITNFYVEAGGQVGDEGRIYNESAEMSVRGVYSVGDWIVHEGPMVRGQLEDFKSEETVTISVNAERRWDIQRNHTATHLMHAALRKALGEHVKQSGSYVGPDRLRFDFSHHQPMTPAEIRQVEEIVNAEILKGTSVNTEEMEADKAKASGAMALFGEKYGDKVRVVSVGEFSKELCGGTHVENVGQIGPFMITLATGIASGIRRIEAITGREANRQLLDNKAFRHLVASLVNRPLAEALIGLEKLRDENVALQKELKKTKEAMFAGGSSSVGTEEKIGELTLFTHDFGQSDRDSMGAWLDSLKEKNEPLAVVAVGLINGKVTFMAAGSSAAVKSSGLHIGNLTKEVLSQFGGRGGGKPNFAQGSVVDGTNSEDIFKATKVCLSKL